MKRAAILVCCLGVLGWSGAKAAPTPNPGGDTVVTNSTTATATYVTNPVTNMVSDFSTTITAFLNGSLVFSGVYAQPFTDPIVQTAVADADFILALNSASYGAPVLFSTATTTSSVTAAPVIPSLSCAQLVSGGYTQNSAVSITQTQTFGPATVPVGTCLQDTFTILPGQLDININTDIGYDVPVNAVTTVTSTTTQVYDIFGLTAPTPPTPVSVPEPGSGALLLAGAGAVALRQRRIRMIMGRAKVFLCCLGALGWSEAQAAPAPNPGGGTVITNSTTATATYVTNPVTNMVSDFSTTITALLNGAPVFSQSFGLPFGDATVQQAVAAADAILAGDGASFGAPVLASTATTTASSTAAPIIPSLSCAQLLSGGYTNNGMNTVTSVQTFGPATIAVGNCQQDTFTILPGQLDININTDFGYDVPVNAVTTVTSTTTQVYDIFGLTAATPPTPVSVPEPGSAALLLAGAGAVALRKRLR